MKTHKDLEVWKKSLAFVTAVYKNTHSFPAEERYGLTSQVKRSAVSIPSNIAEGAARNSKKEWIEFLYIALGSASELETQLLIALNLGFITSEENNTLQSELETISKMIYGLIKFNKGVSD
jgi:four helix bundle protein